MDASENHQRINKERFNRISSQFHASISQIMKESASIEISIPKLRRNGAWRCARNATQTSHAIEEITYNSNVHTGHHCQSPLHLAAHAILRWYWFFRPTFFRAFLSHFREWNSPPITLNVHVFWTIIMIFQLFAWPFSYNELYSPIFYI